MRKLLYLGLILLLALPLTAQDDGRTIVSVIVPFFVETQIDQSIIDAFEAQNPDLKIEIKSVDNFGQPYNPGDPVEDYLDDYATYVGQADVVVVDVNTTPEVTRAGYLLDLSPLVSVDAGFDVFDYYDPVWRSFQWDGGTWALPAGAEVSLLYYDPAAFDAAGLAYPDAAWSVFDFENAVINLSQFDTDGTTVVPGFLSRGGDLSGLLVATGRGVVYNDMVFPSVPDYSSPDLVTAIDIWSLLQQEGHFDTPSDLDPNSVPLQYGTSFVGGVLPDRFQAALLPGGQAGLNVTGFAVSAGTQNPEPAYRLAKYLASSAEIAELFFAATPARRSLTPLDIDPVILQGLESGIPMSDLRFADPLEDAITQVALGQTNTQDAIRDTEVAVLDRLIAADARAAEPLPLVQNVDPTAGLAPGEVALRFGVATVFRPLPNQAAWDAAAATFAANDFEVGFVAVESAFPLQLEQLAAEFDCFYSFNNFIPEADLSLLVPLDPLLASDPGFDPNDFPVLGQVRRADQTWALPLTVSPLAMRYDPDTFAIAGAFPPIGGWSVPDFENALRTIQPTLPEGAYAFDPNAFDNAYLLTLIAAYGGILYDYRTDPPTVDFTSAASVQAAQQVLDLAKNGFMNYDPLSDLINFQAFLDDGTAERAVYVEALNGVADFISTFTGGPTSTDNTDVLVSFPRGSQFQAVALDTGPLYISASTPYVDACYRFISTLSRNPEIPITMPARSSIINDPLLPTVQGQATVDYYRELDAVMRQPDTLIVPTALTARSALSQIWLNRAFDRYVLDDADLLAELEDAQTFTTAFLECVDNIPPFDPNVDDEFGFFEAYGECATRIDPSIELGPNGD